MTLNTIKKISILQELELSIETIKSGLSIIQSIQPMKTPVFLIFLILSTGIERLLKIVINLRLLSGNKPLLSETELRKTYRHNSVGLKDRLVFECFTGNSKTQVVNEDKNFLEKDTLLNEILKQLSEFADKDRYPYLDKLTDEKSTGVWLSTRWDEIEKTIIPQHEAIKLILEGKENEYKKLISVNFVISIERFVRAICRIITLGEMNHFANSAGTLLYDFLFLRDDDLGKTNYGLFGHSLS